MNPDDRQQKVIAKGVTEGILKAVGILALLGLVAAIVIGIANSSSSSFTSGGTVASPARGIPVVVLVFNQTSDSLSYELRSDSGRIARDVIGPGKAGACENFHVLGTLGQPWKASFEVRNLRTGQRDTSGWFELNVPGPPPTWIDTVRAGHEHGLRRYNDANLFSRSDCQPW
jgi:hypothetical protein